jgi:hypothetical protein
MNSCSPFYLSKRNLRPKPAVRKPNNAGSAFLHNSPLPLQARSFNCVMPAVRAQWTQQKICPFASTPCPTIRQLQCGQTGASAWMAHSKLSKV